MNEFNTVSDDVIDEAFEVFSTMELLEMGLIDEATMNELMEPVTVAAVE